MPGMSYPNPSQAPYSDWWADQRKRQGVTGSPIAFSNDRPDPYRVFNEYESESVAGDLDSDVQAARRKAGQFKERKPMRAIVNGQEFVMEQKGRTIREDEAKRLVSEAAQQRRIDEDRAQAIEDKRIAREAAQAKIDAEKRMADLEIQRAGLGVAKATRENNAADDEFKRKQSADAQLAQAIEGNQFTALGVSAQDAPIVVNAYRTGGVEGARQALSDLQRRNIEVPRAQAEAAIEKLLAAGRITEATAVATMAGIPTGLGAIGKVVVPMQDAQRRAEAEAQRIGTGLQAFAQQDIDIGVDPTQDDVTRYSKEIEALVKLYEQSGMPYEEARNKAIQLANEKLSGAASKWRGGWSQTLLQSIGAR